MFKIDEHKKRQEDNASWLWWSYCIWVLKKNDSFICKDCFENAKQSITDKKNAERKEEAMYNQIHHICSELSSDASHDIKILKSAPLREINDILSYKALGWLSNRPEKLVYLISEVCNVDINTASHSQLILVAKPLSLFILAVARKLFSQIIS